LAIKVPARLANIYEVYTSPVGDKGARAPGPAPARGAVLKDTASGEIKVTKAFRDKHGAKYARAGIDLTQTYPDENTPISDILLVNFIDEQAELLARELDWLDDEN